jgi:hypothetical protein
MSTPSILEGMSGYGATVVMGGAEAPLVNHLKGTQPLLAKMRLLVTPLLAVRAVTLSIPDQIGVPGSNQRFGA